MISLLCLRFSLALSDQTPSLGLLWQLQLLRRAPFQRLTLPPLGEPAPALQPCERFSSTAKTWLLQPPLMPRLPPLAVLPLLRA
nr:hypothetical protein Iba_chr09bCG14780 [Ipomoea batatas]GMD34677.1 hypothetical protein Iba_chr09cCG14300 [Ipomoea batatas]